MDDWTEAQQPAISKREAETDSKLLRTNSKDTKGFGVYRKGTQAAMQARGKRPPLNYGKGCHRNRHSN